MTESGTDGTRTGRRRRALPGGRGSRGRARAAGIAATVISVVTTVVVAILAVHIVFVVFEANPGNDLVQWFAHRAQDLAWQFEDIFQPDSAKTAVAVNYGLAAVVYLVIGRVITGLVHRLA